MCVVFLMTGPAHQQQHRELRLISRRLVVIAQTDQPQTKRTVFIYGTSNISFEHRRRATRRKNSGAVSGLREKIRRGGAQPSNFMLQDSTDFKSRQGDQRRLCQGQAVTGWHFGALSVLGPYHGMDGQSDGSPVSFRRTWPRNRRMKSRNGRKIIFCSCSICAPNLGVKIVPMFWGVAFGWEVATGYPWGFWKGGDYDLIQEGQERFVKKTPSSANTPTQLGIFLCHEIHPGTAAMCADDFNMLVEVCDGDKCLAVNADPSHCWEGEDWETRFQKMAPRIYACHVKNHVVRPRPAVAHDGTRLAKARHAVCRYSHRAT